MPGKTSSFSIRQAKTEDFVQITTLIHSLFPHANPAYSENNHYIIAEEGGGLCGFVHIRLIRSSLVLQGIGVLPEFRLGGLGGALLDFAIKRVEGKFPHMPLKLKVEPSNIPAISLYLKGGFMLTKDDGAAYRLTRAKPN